jgi:hypothetical protein
LTEEPGRARKGRKGNTVSERERERFKDSSSLMFIYYYYLGGVVYRELAWK